MHRGAAVALLVIAVGCGGWSKRDTLLELGAEATFVGDWRQTRAAIANPRMCEQNPLIGEKGQVSSPEAYFLALGLLHPLVAAALPPRWRAVFQAATIGVESYQIVQNHEVFERMRGDPMATGCDG